MRYVDEYRDPKIAQAMAGEIARKVTRPWVLMEVCGGQTHTLMRYGIDELLPREIELVHGPGCPVCVTPLEMVDRAIRIASLPGVIFTSYGDMLRVPGSESDLFQAKAQGADVRDGVFATGCGENRARESGPQGGVLRGRLRNHRAGQCAWRSGRPSVKGWRNFSMLVSHVLVPPAMRLILSSPSNRVQGFIAPGHVCTVMGYREYEELVGRISRPDGGGRV